MSYNVAIEPKPGYLHITVTGDNAPESVLGYLREVHAACERSGCPRVLVEENLEGASLSVADVCEVVTQRANGVQPVVRTIAFVDCNPKHDPSLMKFAEDVAVNRGINIRVFPTVTEAEAWLKAQG
jgi:hypothetical protein